MLQTKRCRLPRTPLLALIALLSLSAFITPVHSVYAQAPDTLSDEARISLVTVLPGDDLYSAFGHSALRVHDPVQGIDWTYNYGTFDFGSPVTFVPAFAYGRLDYFLSVQPYARAVRYYWLVEERPILEQPLALTAAQRQAIFRFLQTNALPENRFYRYDFFFDNCSTRLRDVLEVALGDEVRFAWPDSTLPSFRRLLDPYLTDQPGLDAGMDLLLGLPADRPATPREATYLPVVLLEATTHAQIRTASGWQPLAPRVDTVAWSAERAAPSSALPWPHLVGWTLFAAILALSWRARQRDAVLRADVWLFGLAGLVGLVLLFLWLVSEHAVTDLNPDLLWAWPTHLIAAVYLARKRHNRIVRGYLTFAAVGTLGVVLTWSLWPYLHPAFLPVALALALRAGALSRTLQPAPAP